MSYQVPRKKKQHPDYKNKMVVTKSGKRIRKVAIPIKGLGTFYVQRRYVALMALMSFITLIGIGAFLWWLWTIRIPELQHAAGMIQVWQAIYS